MHEKQQRQQKMALLVDRYEGYYSRQNHSRCDVEKQWAYVEKGTKTRHSNKRKVRRKRYCSDYQIEIDIQQPNEGTALSVDNIEAHRALHWQLANISRCHDNLNCQEEHSLKMDQCCSCVEKTWEISSSTKRSFPQKTLLYSHRIHQTRNKLIFLLITLIVLSFASPTIKADESVKGKTCNHTNNEQRQRQRHKSLSKDIGSSSLASEETSFPSIINAYNDTLLHDTQRHRSLEAKYLPAPGAGGARSTGFFFTVAINETAIKDSGYSALVINGIDIYMSLQEGSPPVMAELFSRYGSFFDSQQSKKGWDVRWKGQLASTGFGKPTRITNFTSSVELDLTTGNDSMDRDTDGNRIISFYVTLDVMHLVYSPCYEVICNGTESGGEATTGGALLMNATQFRHHTNGDMTIYAGQAAFGYPAFDGVTHTTNVAKLFKGVLYYELLENAEDLPSYGQEPPTVMPTSSPTLSPTQPPPPTSPPTEAPPPTPSPTSSSPTVSPTKLDMDGFHSEEQLSTGIVHDGQRTAFGNLFDLTAISDVHDVIVTSLSFHTQVSIGSLVSVHVYQKKGSYIDDDDDGEWEQVANTRVLSMGFGAPTAIPTSSFRPFKIKAGQTRGIFITLETEDLVYSVIDPDTDKYETNELRMSRCSGVITYISDIANVGLDEHIEEEEVLEERLFEGFIHFLVDRTMAPTPATTFAPTLESTGAPTIAKSPNSAVPSDSTATTFRPSVSPLVDDAEEADEVIDAFTTSKVLETIFSGGNSGHGTMFELKAIYTSVLIREIDFSIEAEGFISDKKLAVHLFSTEGSFIGKESSRDEWKEIRAYVEGTNDLIAVGASDLDSSQHTVLVRLVLEDVLVMEKGDVTSFYLTLEEPNMVYSKAPSSLESNDVFRSSDELEIKVGIGVDYPFGNQEDNIVLNGRIHYSVSSSQPTSAPTTPSSDTLTPLITTKQQIQIAGVNREEVERYISDKEQESFRQYLEIVTMNFLLPILKNNDPPVTIQDVEVYEVFVVDASTSDLVLGTVLSSTLDEGSPSVENTAGRNLIKNRFPHLMFRAQSPSNPLSQVPVLSYEAIINATSAPTSSSVKLSPLVKKAFDEEGTSLIKDLEGTNDDYGLIFDEAFVVYSATMPTDSPMSNRGDASVPPEYSPQPSSNKSTIIIIATCCLVGAFIGGCSGFVFYKRKERTRRTVTSSSERHSLPRTVADMEDLADDEMRQALRDGGGDDNINVMSGGKSRNRPMADGNYEEQALVHNTATSPSPLHFSGAIASNDDAMNVLAAQQHDRTFNKARAAAASSKVSSPYRNDGSSRAPLIKSSKRALNEKVPSYNSGGQETVGAGSSDPLAINRMLRMQHAGQASLEEYSPLHSAPVNINSSQSHNNTSSHIPSPLGLHRAQDVNSLEQQGLQGFTPVSSSFDHDGNGMNMNESLTSNKNSTIVSGAEDDSLESEEDVDDEEEIGSWVDENEEASEGQSVVSGTPDDIPNEESEDDIVEGDDDDDSGSSDSSGSAYSDVSNLSETYEQTWSKISDPDALNSLRRSVEGKSTQEEDIELIEEEEGDEVQDELLTGKNAKSRENSKGGLKSSFTKAFSPALKKNTSSIHSTRSSNMNTSFRSSEEGDAWSFRDEDSGRFDWKMGDDDSIDEKAVRFHPKVVTDVKFRPRTRPEERESLYFSGHKKKKTKKKKKGKK